jgi:hypothetical protein
MMNIRGDVGVTGGWSSLIPMFKTGTLWSVTNTVTATGFFKISLDENWTTGNPLGWQ